MEKRQKSIYVQKPDRAHVIVTACVLVWIFLVNILGILLSALVPVLVTWPMFFVTIFFFALGAKKESIPSIFLGGTLGLAAAWLLYAGTMALASFVGVFGGISIMLAILLSVIILGGTVCPVACNNIAFAYLTVATIQFEQLTPASIGGGLIMLWVGGAVILGGSLVAASLGGKLVAGRGAKKAAAENG
jgi:hypothetical protein